MEKKTTITISPKMEKQLRAKTEELLGLFDYNIDHVGRFINYMIVENKRLVKEGILYESSVSIEMFCSDLENYWKKVQFIFNDYVNNKSITPVG